MFASTPARAWLRAIVSRPSLYRSAGASGRGRSCISHRRFGSHVLYNRSAAFSSHTSSALTDGSGYSSEDSDGKSEMARVDIADDGAHITLQFAKENDELQESKHQSASSSTYHASWLWSNDPRRVMLPSGQRTSTPGQWCAQSRPRIKDAKVVYCNIEQDGDEVDYNEPTLGSSEKSDGEQIMHVPGPTLKDSCHPLAVYGSYPAWISAKLVSASTATDDTAVSSSCRPYLQIEWTTPTTTSNNAQSIQEHTHGTTKSIYDLAWLERFQYNTPSRLAHRTKTEVQPIHAVRNDGPPLWYSTPESALDINSLYPGDEEISLHNINDGLVHVNYDSIIEEDNGSIQKEGLFHLLHSVLRDGAAIVSNTPYSAIDGTSTSQICKAVETCSTI